MAQATFLFGESEDGQEADAARSVQKKIMTDTAKLVRTLEKLFTPVLSGMGLDLWGIDTMGGDGTLTVRVFIERVV